MTTTIKNMRPPACAIAFCAILATIGAPVRAQQCYQGHSPEGLAMDHYGNLWIAYYDTGNLATFDVGENAYFNSGDCGPEPCPPFTPTVSFIDDAAFFPGVGGPTRLSFGANNFYVTNTSANTVTVYYTPNAIVEQGTQLLQATVTGLRRPLGAVADASGNLYVAENATSEITVFNSSYVKIGSLSSDVNGNRFTAPGSLAMSGGFLYVATAAGPVYKYNASMFFNCVLLNAYFPFQTQLPVPLAVYDDSASSGPTGITFDAAGNVYVSYYYTNDVVVYTSSGQEKMRLTTGIYQPEGLVYDTNNGYLYVSNSGTSNIAAYSGSNYEGDLAFLCD
jgi:sugar lactone lactonase YvrE